LKTNQPGAALTNTGFDGIALKAGEKYDFSLFARIPEGSNDDIPKGYGQVYGLPAVR